MNATRSFLIAGALAGLMAAPAHAGLPLLTEDAGVLDPRACEVEAAAFSARVGGASALERSVGLQCGVGFSTQAGVTVARAHAGSESATGLALGGKTGLWRGDKDAALTLAWSAAWQRDSGNGSGSGWRYAGYDLNAVYSRPLAMAEGLTLHANLGHAYDRAARSRATTWALALEHAGWPLGGVTVAPMAELFGDDRDAPFASAALRLTLKPEALWFGLSYGRQLDSERARLATASLKLAF